MMKVNDLHLKDSLKRGIEQLAKRGYLEVAEDGLLLCAKESTKISVEKTAASVTICYDTEPHFYMALIRSMEMKEGVWPIDRKAKRLGLMHDCSRNAVPTTDMVKDLICMLVMCGYDYLELYTEETYELPDEPYFGYKRGRYSTEELKEIVAFADIFGFEMVPCVQTLAHLRRLNNWIMYYDHMDIDDILMVGDERTYALICKMVAYCKEVFETNRIHVGMDEAFHLGRGRYTDTNGYRSKHEVYLEHLRRVFAICKELGMRPDFWADGFYETDLSLEEIKEIFDGSQMPIYWEYSIEEKEPHAQKMSQLKEYAGRVGYAGATWRCLGYAPNNALSDQVANVAFEAAFECGVEDIIMTAWGDDGGECSFYTLLPSMWHAAELIYPIKTDKEKIMDDLSGYTDEEWRMCDKMNYVMPNVTKLCNSVKYLLHNDFLIGLMDANIPDHAGEVYQDLLPQFEKLAQKESRFSYLFKSYAAACKVLIKKATYSKRLYKAYQEKDKDAIKNMGAELEPIKEGLHQFYNAYRIQWLKENKGFGVEILDVRIGGLSSRVDTVEYILKEYLAGRMEKIYELEEGRIEYFCGRLEGDDVYAPLHNVWSTLYTVNHL